VLGSGLLPLRSVLRHREGSRAKLDQVSEAALTLREAARRDGRTFSRSSELRTGMQHHFNYFMPHSVRDQTYRYFTCEKVIFLLMHTVQISPLSQQSLCYWNP
jgi:hypothetical protein